MFSNHKQEKINLDSSDKSPEDTLTDIKDHHVSHDVFSMVAALSLHNLPEGILLYVATVSEESVGIALSIGLIFHKFPEGLVVAMPLYCLRKSMVLAFAVSMVSPIFFMIGAIIGYAVTQNIAYDSFVNGVLMSFATGILFWISISGIMPLSRRLDPLNKVCDVCFLIGLGIVLVSLSILSYAE